LNEKKGRNLVILGAIEKKSGGCLNPKDRVSKGRAQRRRNNTMGIRGGERQISKGKPGLRGWAGEAEWGE